MNTRLRFEDYRKERDDLTLGEAFCRYFNVDDKSLRETKDDTVARAMVEEYFGAWGVI